MNQSLIQETIKSNSVTMIYQNNKRLRSGKINRQQEADISVRWLFESHLNLQESNEDIYVVPIMINYDRVYEPDNLSNHMNGTVPKTYNFYSAMEKMISTPKDNIGQVYVKYLEPINLRSYFADELQKDINIGTVEFEKAAIDFT